MKSIPSYILRNCTIWADEDSKVGQASEITIKFPKEKSEKLRNAGMIKERSGAMGYELEDLEFSMTAQDPHTLGLLTGKPGDERPFMITGALVDEDGTTTSAVYYVRGRVVTNDPGTWKPGDKAELKTTVVQNEAKLTIGGVDVFEIDDFEYKVRGESQTGDIRAALLLS